MTRRRVFLRTAICAFAALAVVAVPAIADELIGKIIKVDIDQKILTVTPKDGGDDVKVTTNDETIYETPKKEGKIDLGKVSKALEKNKNGINVVITHEKAVASRIKVQAKKKAE